MRKSHRAWTVALLVGSAPLLNGCYTYADVGLPVVPPGADVRAQVTDAEAARAQRILGYHAIRFDGVVVQHDDRGLLVRVPTQVYADDGDTRRRFEQLQLMREDVVGLQLRRLSVPRTAGLVALGVAALAFIATRSVGGSGGGSLPPQTQTPRAFVIPIR